MCKEYSSYYQQYTLFMLTYLQTFLSCLVCSILFNFVIVTHCAFVFFFKLELTCLSFFLTFSFSFSLSLACLLLSYSYSFFFFFFLFSLLTNIVNNLVIRWNIRIYVRKGRRRKKERPLQSHKSVQFSSVYIYIFKSQTYYNNIGWAGLKNKRPSV